MGSAANKADGSKLFPWMQSAPKQQAAGSDDLPKPKIVAEPIPRTALGIEELAVSLGVSAGTVRGWRKNKTGPPSFRTPDGRRIRFPIKAVEQWLREQATATEDEFGGEPSRN